MRAGVPRRLFQLCVTVALLFSAVGPTAPSSRAMPGGSGRAQSAVVPAPETACGNASPRECLDLGLRAMGGRERLESIKSLRLDSIGHTLLMEQSYRQAPFLTSYSRIHETIDFARGSVHRETHLTWPEADAGQSDADTTLIVRAEGGVYRTPQGDRSCGLADLDSVGQELALGPARVLLTALAASDLHYDSPEVIRSTPHTAVAFTWKGTPVRILINNYNQLPDAVETLRQFNDFWYFWGDVRQRVYFDNWKVFQGVVYPTNLVEERNGDVWRSLQVLSLEINVPVDDSLFRMDAAIAAKSSQGRGWERPFLGNRSTALAPGITLYEGSWNATIIQMEDGVYLLEAPISGVYMQGLLEAARKLPGGAPIRGVFSTSDSWPHVGGVRQCVAAGLPVYILDLNQPLLERFLRAPHTVHPDLLASQPKAPEWRIVSGRVTVGTGPNRVELYPLRGASTERQYMAYFPEHHLLYASDTLALNDDGSLYDPELMREVSQAVAREHLDVKTVYAMHQAPAPWAQIESLLAAGGKPAKAS